ncbi:MAG: protein kinase, partial [Ktedonobacteraceae bacterium]|nr:protein kinase [Ktedonobacteraceae bacterium]
PAEDIIYIFTGVSLAIDYAHRRNMIHRDIKPANILLDQRPPIEKPLGRPVLIDFGIARLHEVASKTTAGLIIGTPHYSAPEQVQSNALPQSDLYSLGIILYEIMTGVTPFRGETALAVFMQHLQDMPTPPMLINQQITPELSSIILKSIAKNPADRFQSASEMTIALCEACNTPPPAQLLHKQPIILDRASTPAASPTPPTPGRTASSTLSAAVGNTPAHSDPTTPEWTGPAIQPLSHPSQPLHLSRPSAPLRIPAPPGTARRRYGLILLLASLFIAALLGSTLASFQLFSQPASGKASFSSSTQTTDYDQVTIDFTNLPTPPAGKAYYAWIESASYEGEVPHWKLNVNNGSVHTILGQPYPGEHNLLRDNWILLITQESGTPKVSSPDLANRLYYAHLTTGTPAYDFQPCPTDTDQNICLQ